MSLTIQSEKMANSNGFELSRLLTAAVVNQRFCKLLLSDPAKALANGFNGETFRFAKEERERILSIKAQSLADFAGQLVEKRIPNNYRQPVRIPIDQHAFIPAGLD
jgi:hypothetical protein